MGLVFGQLAYIYVWRIWRGIAVFLLNFLLIWMLFGSEPDYTPELLAASIAINIMISFDCWRITKLSQPDNSAKKTVRTEPALVIPKDIYCPKCGIGLAFPMKKCPQCRAETKIVV